MWNNQYQYHKKQLSEQSSPQHIHVNSWSLGSVSGILTNYFFFSFEQLLKVIALALRHGLFIFDSSLENNTALL